MQDNRVIINKISITIHFSTNGLLVVRWFNVKTANFGTTLNVSISKKTKQIKISHVTSRKNKNLVLKLEINTQQ